MIKPWEELFQTAFQTTDQPGQVDFEDWFDTIRNLGFQRPVLSVGLTTPPVSPGINDRYIVGASATGAWAGQDNKIAEWGDGQWYFEPFFDGASVFNVGDSEYWRYSGTSWDQFDQGTSSHPYSITTTWAQTKSLIETDADVIIFAFNNEITTSDGFTPKRINKVYSFPGEPIKILNGVSDVTLSIVTGGDFFTSEMYFYAPFVGEGGQNYNIDLGFPPTVASDHIIRFTSLSQISITTNDNFTQYDVLYERCDLPDASVDFEVYCNAWSGTRDVLRKSAQFFTLNPLVESYFGGPLDPETVATLEILGRFGFEFFTDNDNSSFGVKNRKISIKGDGQFPSAEVSTSTEGSLLDSRITVSVADKDTDGGTLNDILFLTGSFIAGFDTPGGLPFPWSSAVKLSPFDIGDNFSIGQFAGENTESEEMTAFICKNCYKDTDATFPSRNYLEGWKAKGTGATNTYAHLTVWRKGIKAEFVSSATLAADSAITWNLVKATDERGNDSYHFFNQGVPNEEYKFFPSNLFAYGRHVIHKGGQITEMYETGIITRIHGGYYNSSRNIVLLKDTIIGVGAFVIEERDLALRKYRTTDGLTGDVVVASTQTYDFDNVTGDLRIQNGSSFLSDL